MTCDETRTVALSSRRSSNRGTLQTWLPLDVLYDNLPFRFCFFSFGCHLLPLPSAAPRGFTTVSVRHYTRTGGANYVSFSLSLFLFAVLDVVHVLRAPIARAVYMTRSALFYVSDVVVVCFVFRLSLWFALSFSLFLFLSLSLRDRRRERPPTPPSCVSLCHRVVVGPFRTFHRL